MPRSSPSHGSGRHRAVAGSRLASTVLALTLILALTSCSEGASTGAPPSTSVDQPGSTSSLNPDDVIGSKDLTPLQRLNRACAERTQDLAKGRAVFPRHLDMTVGAETTVRAAVTLDATRSPGDVLGQPSVPATALSVIAACFVNASLTGSDAFVVTSLVASGPQQISDSHDAVWLWSVTPKRKGDFVLTVSFWPLLQANGTATTPTSLSADQVTPVTIDVSVAAPLGQDLKSGTTEATDWLNALGKLLGALAALLLAAWAVRSAWRKRTEPRSGGSAADERPKEPSEPPAG